MTWKTLTAATPLVVHDERLLMIRERRPSGLWWSVPGGYAEAGESLEEAAAREGEEETGVAVSVGALVCTLIWEYAAKHRRNVIAYFEAAPLGRPVPRPQTEEAIEAVEFVVPTELDAQEIHPQTRAVLERWWPARGNCPPFHLVADIVMRPGGSSPEYVFRV
jgi:ADP-ribose pyrophosphatase YjhB (NUDIX family)